MKLGFILFSAAFMMLAISAKIERGRQVVSDISINIDHTTGHFFITEEDVFESLDELLPDSGAPINTEHLSNIEAQLAKVPQIESSNVFVDNLGQLTIDIHQRQPVYRVIRKNMKSYYVDKNGYKFPVSRKYTANVPVVTGFIADNGKNVGPMQTALSIDIRNVMLKLIEDEFLSAQFGQLDVTDKGELELIPRVGDHVVQLGNSENIEDKLLRLKIFYNEGLKKAGWNTYKTINVKYKDQVVCTK
jgi:cell division protein FtsQ